MALRVAFNPHLGWVWAVPRSLATTNGMLSLPRGTKMFQFPRFPTQSYVFTLGCTGMPLCGFPHSDIPGCCGCTHLAEAFRSVPRPSSAQDTKASTVCPCSLPSPVRLLCIACSRIGFIRRPGWSGADCHPPGFPSVRIPQRSRFFFFVCV